MSESFYRAFEEIHRGSRALIKSRLLAYNPFITLLGSIAFPPTAIDLGCGRGEWLELLDEHGFDARGVDLNESMLAACRKAGMQVQNADAIATLRALPNESMVLVSAFHVVEHMPFDDVQTLVQEALRVLKPGGLLILETPNSENIVVGASEFYKDPSHARPVPWALLQFATEYVGFRRNIVVRLQEASALHTTSEIRLIDVLSGVSPDYAVVAQKNGSADILSTFDPPFNKNYGISLDTLAERYELQAEKMRKDLVQINDRLAIAEQRLNAVFLSRSWRITAPLRLLTDVLRALELPALKRTLTSNGRRGVKALLQRTGRMILRHPPLKKMAFNLLAYTPTLKERLHNILHAQKNILPDAQPSEITPAHLTPRALAIYTELKAIVDKKEA